MASFYNWIQFEYQVVYKLPLLRGVKVFFILDIQRLDTPMK
jgi:hypothetical protein